METFSVGEEVKVAEPFSVSLPDTYKIESITEDGTCTLENGVDFHISNLIKL